MSKYWILLLCFWASLAFSLESDRDAPIQLEAQTATVDAKSNTAIYSGNVVLTQGSIRIEADEITITTRNNTLETATILGKKSLARFSHQPEPGRRVDGQARKIVLSQTDKEISFHDEAEIIDGNNKIKGQYIRYDQSSSQITATGGDTNVPVRITFQPDSDNTQNNVSTHKKDSP